MSDWSLFLFAAGVGTVCIISGILLKIARRCGWSMNIVYLLSAICGVTLIAYAIIFVQILLN